MNAFTEATGIGVIKRVIMVGCGRAPPEKGSRSTNILLSKWSLRMASTTDNKSSLRGGPRKVGWMIGGLFEHDHSDSDQETLEAGNGYAYGHQLIMTIGARLFVANQIVVGL